MTLASLHFVLNAGFFLTFTVHYSINLYRHLMDNKIVTIDRGAFNDLKELDRL